MKKDNLKLYVFFAALVVFSPHALAATTSTPSSLEQLQSDIASVSQKISQLTVGVTITDPFNGELQNVQSMEIQAARLQENDNIGAQDIIDSAEARLKKLDQLVDLTSGAEGDMSGDDAAQLQGIKQDVDSVEVQINKITINGGDTTALKSILQEVKGLVSSAQGSINNGDMSGANIIIKKAHDRLDNLNDSLDGALDIDYDGSRKLIRYYDNAISGLVDDLKSLALIDSENGKQIETVAVSQDSSLHDVENLVASISARRGFVKFLIGANNNSIEKLLVQIDDNKKDIESLKSVENRENDPAAAAVLQTQIQILQQQTASLENYIQANDGGYSLFGWFLKYL